MDYVIYLYAIMIKLLLVPCFQPLGIGCANVRFLVPMTMYLTNTIPCISYEGNMLVYTTLYTK
jgi:hypothetical protein